MKSVKLTNLLQPLVEDLGYEFVGLEHGSNPKNPVLVIYIDKAEGIAVQDCEKVSREVAALLDVEDPIPGHYNLEISSPGLERPLVKLADFERFSGREVKVRTRTTIDRQRRFHGKLLGVVDRSVQLDQDGRVLLIPHEEIAQANLVYRFSN